MSLIAQKMVLFQPWNEAAHADHVLNDVKSTGSSLGGNPFLRMGIFPDCLTLSNASQRRMGRSGNGTKRLKVAVMTRARDCPVCTRCSRAEEMDHTGLLINTFNCNFCLVGFF